MYGLGNSAARGRLNDIRKKGGLIDREAMKDGLLVA